MNTYIVYMPVTASIAVEVEADNEESAKEKALESDFTLSIETTCSAEITEWEIHEKVVRGNVFYGVRNEIEVEEV